MHNVREYLRWLKHDFEQAGIDCADFTAKEIMAHALGCRRGEIYLRGDEPLSFPQQRRLESLATRIVTHEPVQYVIGQVGFRDIIVKTDRRALIPRPETELLVGEALKILRPGMRAADIGTGSGCLIISLASEFPSAKYTAVDLSSDALALAQQNAVLNGVDNRIHFLQGDLLEPFKPRSLDVIISNPPYIPSKTIEKLDQSVRSYEPLQALDGGTDGLDCYRRLLKQAVTVLKPGGHLFLEIGFDQGAALREMLTAEGFEQIEIKQDLARLDRMAIAVLPAG